MKSDEGCGYSSASRCFRFFASGNEWHPSAEILHSSPRKPETLGQCIRRTKKVRLGMEVFNKMQDSLKSSQMQDAPGYWHICFWDSYGCFQPCAGQVACVFWMSLGSSRCLNSDQRHVLCAKIPVWRSESAVQTGPKVLQRQRCLYHTRVPSSWHFDNLNLDQATSLTRLKTDTGVQKQ